MKKGYTIFLAGDSTVQSYAEKSFPQTGWGQVLVDCMLQQIEEEVQNNDMVKMDGEDRQYIDCRMWDDYEGEQTTCSLMKTEIHPLIQFPNVTLHEIINASGETICRIENHAMAGRSARKFLDEGRYEPMLERMRAGDILLIQFGHNDANREKAERYVTPEQFHKKLMEMITPAREKGVTCILVTPIAMREFSQDGICQISFPEYREAMLELADREQISDIDLGLLTAQYCTELGEEACKKIFLWVAAGEYEAFPEGSQDNAHLQYDGAVAFAEILVQKMKCILR